MKRFTETSKWSDKWYRNLSPTLKLGYGYLLDCCDCAGVIELDEELAEFQIGAAVDWQKLIDESGGRLEKMSSGEIWVTKFIDYQYGGMDRLSPDCKAHQPILKAIEKHGLKGYPKGIQRVSKGSKTSKEKDNTRIGSSKKKDGENFELFWQAFPVGRKKSKGAARKAWDKAVESEDAETLIAAAADYAASHEGKGEFVKMPSTWLNQECWRDDREAWNRSSNGKDATATEIPF